MVKPHICQCLRHLAVLGSDSPLTICGNRKKTGRQFVDEVLSLACRLAELGIRRGDVVAISALNRLSAKIVFCVIHQRVHYLCACVCLSVFSDWYLEWLLAVTYVGGIVAPLNYRWVSYCGTSLVCAVKK